MNEMTRSSPSKSAGTVSTALARPSVCASMTTFPEPNVSRTGLARSATSDTLRTASVNGPAGSVARDPNPSGNLDWYLMNSPPISRAVSLRFPPAKLITPSAGRGSRAGPSAGPVSLPGWPASNATVTGTPAVTDRATSARVLAGTIAAALRPRAAGSQRTSLTASRYRSVAASVSVSSCTSRQTAVSMGSVSSRLAAGTT